MHISVDLWRLDASIFILAFAFRFQAVITGVHACYDVRNGSMQPGVEDECFLRYVA